ncbi:MAG: HD domain-containing protein [Candidatus Omnitrophota bacterium]|nr:HD domain-containing protein [Candidatus Omnitrophota bacterium]MDZ4243236.1 HD domain-containing protein [Candidatus Omnitrophota bacterium]
MRSAVIDIGSSSIKLVIGEREGDDIRVIETLKNVIPIGRQSLFKGRISQEIINQTTGLLEKYKQTIKEYEVADVRVIATTAVREARNRSVFLDTVLRKTGLRIEVLNVGDVVYYIDAFLTHKLKKKYPIHEKNLLIAELGAGSVDISVMEKGYTLFNVGFPIGTLRLKEFMGKLDGSQEEIHEAVKEYLQNEISYFKKTNPGLQIDDVILIDENYSVFLPNILPSKKRESDFFPFKQEECEEFLAKMTETNADGLAKAYKVPLETAETIGGYALIVNAIFQLTPNKYIYILETSLSEAILANMFLNLELGQDSNRKDHLISVANYLCRKYHTDQKHARHVAVLSETLFENLKEVLGLQDKGLIYLLLAAYLHDIGMFINNRAHHKHTEYIISSLNLFRLTDEEIKMIACIGRYHRKGFPDPTHILYNSLPSEQQILVQKLSAILRIANSLDRSHQQKVKKLEVKLNRRQDVTLIAYSTDNLILEKSYFQDKKELFEEIAGSRITLAVRLQN